MHQAASQTAPLGTANPRKKFRRRGYIIWGSVGLLLLWIIVSIINGKREKPVPVTTDKAVRRNIIETVSATGKVQPETEVKIFCEVAGEIIELPVEDGQAVKKGDLLVKINPDVYKAIFEQQEAAISTAKATNLQQKATMVKATADEKRAEDMFTKKTISVQELDAARAASDVAKNTFESSLHQVEMAEAASSQARDQLSKTTVYSPLDGNVTLLNSKLGERVVANSQFAGTEVMRVADLRHMEARVDVNENDVVNVKNGDKTTIKIDAFPERRFHGVIYQIANTGKTTGTGTQEEVTNFEVKIRIDEHDVVLKPGLSCTAEIETNSASNVIAVPMQSVTIRSADSTLSPEELEKKKMKQSQRDQADNSAELTNEKLEKQQQKVEHEKILKVVFLKKGSKAQMVKVTTGISDDTFTEIKSGVQPGDEVISGSYSAISRKLKDNAKVTYDKEAAK
jgi:HlyD family secretion protein